MGYTATKAVNVAIAELDYHEKASNSQLDSKTANSGSKNYNKYARDLAEAGFYNGSKQAQPWCDIFNDAVHFYASGRNAKVAQEVICQTGDLGAGCGYSMGYYQQAGRFDKTPKVGDQIFFRYSGTTSGADHTGIVIEVTADKVVTIEGNKGDKVSKCTYSRNDPTIYGYGHPRYDAEPVVAKTCTIELPVLRKGDKGEAVKTVQRILKQLGYIGADGELLKVDGDFGANTEYAVKRFQFRRGSTLRDGIVGVWTWGKLLKM